MNQAVSLFGSLAEQLERCDRVIAECTSKLQNPDYPDHAGAAIGWLDWVRNRELILEEMRMHSPHQEQAA